MLRVFKKINREKKGYFWIRFYKESGNLFFEHYEDIERMT